MSIFMLASWIRSLGCDAKRVREGSFVGYELLGCTYKAVFELSIFTIYIHSIRSRDTQDTLQTNHGMNVRLTRTRIVIDMSGRQ